MQHALRIRYRYSVFYCYCRQALLRVRIDTESATRSRPREGHEDGIAAAPPSRVVPPNRRVCGVRSVLIELELESRRSTGSREYWVGGREGLWMMHEVLKRNVR